MEKLLKEVEKLNTNTPDGVVVDADTILVDVIQKVEQMFFEFTDMEFKDYLKKCKEEITR